MSMSLVVYDVEMAVKALEREQIVREAERIARLGLDDERRRGVLGWLLSLFEADYAIRMPSPRHIPTPATQPAPAPARGRVHRQQPICPDCGRLLGGSHGGPYRCSRRPALRQAP